MRTGVRNINLLDIHIKWTAAMLMVEISGEELTQEIHWGKDATTETLLQRREFALVNNLSSFHLKT